MTLLTDNLQNSDFLIDNFSYIDIDLSQTHEFIPNSLDYVSNCKISTGITPIVNDFFQTVTASNTEIHVQKQAKTCVVVTGESWTYGDRLHEHDQMVVKAMTGDDKIQYRLNNIFAWHCARLLKSDLYLSAVPGNSNTGIVLHLPNILRYLQQFDYDKIFVVVQITSPGRCFGDSRWNSTDDYWQNYMGNTLGVVKPNNNLFSKGMITLDQWYDLYEQGMIDLINKICNKFDIVDWISWKNFNPIKNPSNRIVRLPWVKFLANLYNCEFDLPNCNEAQWFADLNKIFVLEPCDHERKMLELDKIEQSNEFLRQSPLNHWHPQASAHHMWAMYLLEQAGWWQHEI